MNQRELVGVAVGVIRGGRVVYLKGFGFEDHEAGIPVTRVTLFRWASISKTLTAVTAMQLAERGQLDLDADVRTYVPEFPDKGEVITSRQLLCHQGGIVHYKNGPVMRVRRKYDVPHPFESVIVALDRFKKSPLIAPPGQKYSYTTHGFILLSAVVERAGGERFADQVRKRIVEPLGLGTLQPDYQWREIPHRAVGYRKRKGRVVRSTNTDVSWKLGGGGYLSNIDDMARYATGLINRRLVSKATETAMWTPQKTADGKQTKYGLGFFVNRRGKTPLVAHGGSQEKTKTQLTIRPREGSGVVVMSNSEYANPKRLVAIIEKALAETPAEPVCRPPSKPTCRPRHCWRWRRFIQRTRCRMRACTHCRSR
jgi:CubicO group peptidase (beta-lactamase class C family)